MKMTEFKKKLLFAAFAAVDFFAAVELTAFIVAVPEVANYFKLDADKISWILNSYLYVVFGTLVVFYFLSKRIKHTANVKAFFLFGLGCFLIGSVIGSFSTSIEMFYIARVIQGIGAAVSFIGQLWIMTYSFKDEIGRPLFWTETGAAMGVLAGPFLGGIFSDMSFRGWRYIFDFNALIALIALVVVFFIYNAKPHKVLLSEKKFRKDFYFTMIIIIAVISVAVASEFVVSIFLQRFKNYSGLSTGLVLLSGSIGLVYGSALAVKFKTKKKHQIIKGLWGMLLSIVFLGLVLSLGLFLLSPISFFAIGFFYGFLGVVLYAYISHMLPQNLLVKGVTLYLIALQLGNATGIYFEKIWNYFGYNFFVFTILMLAVALVALFFAAQLSILENIDGDLYEVAPLRKTFFHLFSNLYSEIASFFQALFFILIILPFKYIFNIKVYGLADVKIEDQMFFIANHGARLDAWIILSALGLKNYLKLHPFRIPIAKVVYEIPVLRMLFAGTGMYKIESLGDLEKSLENTFKHIDNGHSIIFFPHGKMLKRGEHADPKKGIAHIVKNKQINIVPAKIIYASHNGSNRGKMRNAKVIFGAAVHSDHLRINNVEENLHHAVMEYVHRLEIKTEKSFHLRISQYAETSRVFSEDKLASLLNVIQGSFPSYWNDGHDKKFYKSALMDGDNIVIFLKEGEDIVGCLVAIPHNSIVNKLKKNDCLIGNLKRECFYVETMAVLPGHRNKFGHFKLLFELVSESKKRGIDSYSMHVRKKNGFNKQILRLFKKEITLVRDMNWKFEGKSEPMDYIECRFPKPIVYLKFLFFVYRIYIGMIKFKKRFNVKMIVSDLMRGDES